MAKQEPDNYKVAAQNRRARFDYELIDKVQAGIVLLGTEVKSLRMGKGSIAEAHAAEMDGELFLFNANILPYPYTRHFNHEPRRPRKLLVRKKELNKLLGAIRKKGLTVVPIVLYFNHKGYVKLEIALARGKKTVDKRETIKERDWKRDKSRVLKNQQY